MTTSSATPRLALLCLCLGALACRRAPLKGSADSGADSTRAADAPAGGSAGAPALDGGGAGATHSDAGSSADVTEAGSDGDARDARVPVDGELALIATPYPNAAPPWSWPSSLPLKTPPAPPVSMGPPICYGGGWCWSNPLPMGGHVAVSAVAADDVWVVGAQGSARHFDGQTWKNVPTPTTSDLVDVWGSSTNAVWATSQDGLWRWDGATWSMVDAGDRTGDRLGGLGPTDLWLGTSLPMSTLSHDGPQGWRDVGAFGATDLFATADGALYASLAGEDDELLWIQPGAAPQTFDSGDVFAPNGVWATSHNDVWLTYASVLRHFDGATWKNVLGLSGGTPGLTGVRGTVAGDLWLSAWDGAMLRMSGGNAERWDADLSSALHVSVRAADDVWASGEGGSLSHFDGTSWQRRGSGVRIQWIDQLLDVGADELWALGGARGQPKILRHPSGGEWQELPSGFPETTLYTGWASAPNDVWVAGAGVTPTASSVLAHWDGAAWSRVALPTGLVTSLWGTGPNDVWLGGDDGGLWRWDGISFRPMAPPPGVTLRGWGGLTGTSTSDVWALAWIKGDEYRLFRWDGAAWTDLSPAMDVRWVAARGANDVFAASANQLFHFDGHDWTSLAGTGSNSFFGALYLGAGDLWMGTSLGVSRWDGTKFTTPDPLPSGCYVVRPMTNDVWVACRDGTNGGILRRPR